MEVPVGIVHHLDEDLAGFDHITAHLVEDLEKLLIPGKKSGHVFDKCGPAADLADEI